MFAIGRGGRHLGVHQFKEDAHARPVFDNARKRHLAFVEDGPERGLYLLSEEGN